MARFESESNRTVKAKCAAWKGRRDPAGEAAFEELLREPNNPIRRVLDLLLEQAKVMISDGRLKMVDGLPVLSPEVEQIMEQREARMHSRCTNSDPCGGVHNKKISKALPRPSQTPSLGK